MKRAVEVFEFELGVAGAPVATTWRTASGQGEEGFISVAVTNWEMVVTRQETGVWVTVRGPETRATAAAIPEEAEFFGIQFSLGTFMPGLELARLVDGSATLPLLSPTEFRLDGAAWELPTYDNADVFVQRLVKEGLLVHDQVVSVALEDEPNGLSTRATERRVKRATGLTLGTIRQIRRAERAVDLLGRGVSATDVARLAGYADQPHLTRSLKRFVGLTPFSFKTPPPAGD